MAKSVGIIVHRSNPAAWEFAQTVIGWLQARGVTVRLDLDTANRLNQATLAAPLCDQENVDLIITLGGDGTILQAARMAAPCGIPILGVHMGNFGFHAETTPHELMSHLEKILDGKSRFEERLMVRAEVWREGECIHSSIGLNDAVIRSAAPHLLHLKTFLRNHHFATYHADGIIVSSPTGSTGYAMSAGGPVVEPTVQALVIVPICPHTLSARPMVVPCDEIIEIELASEGDGRSVFSVDGVEPRDLQTSDRIVVRRADYMTRLIVLHHATFYRKVRARYRYGERENQ